MMKSRTVDWPNLNYTVVFEPTNEVVINFRAYEIIIVDGQRHFNLKDGNGIGDWTKDLEQAEVFATGHVKFDGCSNLTFPVTEKVALHFCGRKALGNLGILLEGIFDTCQSMIRLQKEGFEG